MNINKYDLINKGNMGKNEYNYIKELNDNCNSNNDCLFILIPREFEELQTNKIMLDYVFDNYEIIEKVGIYEIYAKEKLINKNN